MISRYLNMKRTRITFYILTLIITLDIFCSPGIARISPLAFKNITRHLRNKFYSPTLGMVALENGLIYNLRFYGDFKSGRDQNNNRRYINDKTINDAHWALIKQLFPSPTGTLAAETNSRTNFGKYANIEIVATLLNYSYFLRNHLKKENTSNDNDNKQTMDVRSFKEFVKRKIISASEDQELLLNKKGKPSIPLTLNQIITIERNKIFESIKKNFQNQKVNPEKRYWQNLQEILKSIEDAIRFENQNGFYPQYTTEQIILAFFCEKFNNQIDIIKLLQHLSPELTQDMEEFDGTIKEDLLTPQDLKKLQDIPPPRESADFDELYALANVDIFTRTTPYKLGSSGAISNGEAFAYNRIDHLLTTDSYPDCVETALRHIINLILYDPHSRIFNLKDIEDYANKKRISNTQSYKNFISFYGSQPPIFANSGDIHLRSLWSMVVSDLNVSPENKIKNEEIPEYNKILLRNNIINNDDNNYLKHENAAFENTDSKIFYGNKKQGYEYEIDPGFINLVKVFQILFDFKLSNDTDKSDNIYNTDIDTKKKWIKNYLEEFFKILNSQRTYKVNTDNLYEKEVFTANKARKDLFGDVKVEVTWQDSNQSRTSFSFIIDATPGHGEIKDLTQTDSTPSLLDAALINLLQMGTSEKSFYLLLPSNEKQKIQLSSIEPLYALFQECLQDQKAKIHLLKILNEKDWFTYYSTTIPILKHVLDGIDWYDDDTLEKTTPIIFTLWDTYQNLPVIPSILSDHVKGLALMIKEDFSIPKLFLNFPKLENFKFHTNNDNLEIPTMQNLKKLTIFAPNIKILDIKTLPSLEKLYLTDIYDLKAVSLTTENAPYLKKLHIEKSSDLSEIHLNLPELENLFLSELRNIETFYLDDDTLPKLKRLTINKLYKLKNIPFKNKKLSELESLNLSAELDINELHLDGDNLPKLKYLSIASLSNLHNLTFYELTELESLTLEKLGNLKDLQLSGFDLPYLKYLSLNQIDLLENLDLRYILNLENLDMSGLNKLEKILFLNEENLPRLTNLIIEDLNSISSLYLTSLPALQRVKLINTELPENFFVNDLKELKNLTIINSGKTIYVETKDPGNGFKKPNYQLDKRDLGNTLKNLGNNAPELERLILGRVSVLNDPFSINNLSKLHTFIMSDFTSKTLELSSLPSLKNLTLDKTTLNSLRLEKMPELERLELKRSSISNNSFSIDNLPKLHTLIMSDFTSKTLELSSLPSLKNLGLAHITLYSPLKLINLPELHRVHLNYIKTDPKYGNRFSITLKNLTNLNEIVLENCSNKTLKSVFLIDLPILQTIWLRNITLAQLDRNSGIYFYQENLPQLAKVTEEFYDRRYGTKRVELSPQKGLEKFLNITSSPERPKS